MLADIWKAFSEAGFMDLWGNGSTWFAGVWTGPQHDLICVKHCDTNEEAEIWLSPEGKMPEEAVELALKKRADLTAAEVQNHQSVASGAQKHEMRHEGRLVRLRRAP